LLVRPEMTFSLDGEIKAQDLSPVKRTLGRLTQGPDAPTLVSQILIGNKKRQKTERLKKHVIFHH